MTRRKRSQSETAIRTAKKRKYEGTMLQQGSIEHYSNAVSDTEDLHRDHYSQILGDDHWDNLEREYEEKRVKLGLQEDIITEGLPIKINGRIERKIIRRQLWKSGSKHDLDNFKHIEDKPQPGPKIGEGIEEERDGNDEHRQVPTTEEKIIELKEEITDLVTNILEEPEENVARLSRLCKMVASKNPNTCKFSMLALVPVFRSIIPGYSIRPLSELEKREKVSKDVAKLRHFEQSLVAVYKNYIEILKQLSKVPNNNDHQKVHLGTLAVQAANELAYNASHFNFRDEMFTLIIRRICKPNLKLDPVSARSIQILGDLLNDDDDGVISLEIMKILYRTAKIRKFNISEYVLNILLGLNILSDYDPNIEDEDKKEKFKMKKRNRIHLSKKQKKSKKEMKQIEKEIREAEHAITIEEREKNQAEILQYLFSLYLNILRAENPKLVGAVLEGLVKFGKMSNLELLGDFLEVMKELIENANLDNISSSEVRKILLCVVSSFSIVSNHSKMKLNIDMSSLVDAIYALLPSISLDTNIEFSHNTVGLPDSCNKKIMRPSVNIATEAELLLKALDHIFFRSRSGTRQRAAAFTKRIYMCMEHTPARTSTALLKFLDKLMSKYPEIGCLYSTEDRIGNGNFIMQANKPAFSNPTSATLWENCLLVNHYCPAVVKGVHFLRNRSKETT